jgi:hypothetical protein
MRQQEHRRLLSRSREGKTPHAATMTWRETWKEKRWR